MKDEEFNRLLCEAPGNSYYDRSVFDLGDELVDPSSSPEVTPD